MSDGRPPENGWRARKRIPMGDRDRESIAAIVLKDVAQQPLFSLFVTHVPLQYSAAESCAGVTAACYAVAVRRECRKCMLDTSRP
jgi:hypothetical protein